jgi:hypothetical protein
MSYLDKYPDCLGCPVTKYCGTVVGSIKLCNSYNDSMQQESAHSLLLSKAATASEDNNSNSHEEE